ncbi:hypothetical protein ONZ51_g7779 [Trametes cubensis]|uniref:Uncharacterized protein n=1 Tax=Trametes cubensis TaxID=1111947 RepID=A0AAD7TPH6_9APHY|nr:hypothetical protein ONZ51_g7779 [Trametes cubensis]
MHKGRLPRDDMMVQMSPYSLQQHPGNRGRSRQLQSTPVVILARPFPWPNINAFGTMFSSTEPINGHSLRTAIVSVFGVKRTCSGLVLDAWTNVHIFRCTAQSQVPSVGVLAGFWPRQHSSSAYYEPADAPADGDHTERRPGGSFQTCNFSGTTMNNTRSSFGVNMPSEFSGDVDNWSISIDGTTLSWPDDTEDGLKNSALASMDALCD